MTPEQIVTAFTNGDVDAAKAGFRGLLDTAAQTLKQNYHEAASASFLTGKGVTDDS